MLLAFCRRRARTGAAILAACFALSACYRAVPVRAAPRVGTELVLDMTSDATEQLGGFLGRGVVSARGRLVDWAADSVVVSMLATVNTNGEEQLWRRERVAVPRVAIARITERRVSRGRTAVVVGMAAAVLVAAIGLATSGEDGPAGGGTKPPPQ